MTDVPLREIDGMKVIEGTTCDVVARKRSGEMQSQMEGFLPLDSFKQAFRHQSHSDRSYSDEAFHIRVISIYFNIFVPSNVDGLHMLYVIAQGYSLFRT